jgi:serine/threonine-protein kinase
LIFVVKKENLLRYRSQDARFLKRFRHEAQAAIKLRHTSVVEVVDLDQAEDGAPCIAMEYVEGEDLRHALAAGAFPVERALAIARGIAQGLGAAHAKGIVHRDVKPESILLAGGDGASETPRSSTSALRLSRRAPRLEMRGTRQRPIESGHRLCESGL